MSENSSEFFSKKLITTPYKNNLEYWRDAIRCAEFLISEYILCKQKDKQEISRKKVLKIFSELEHYINSRLESCTGDAEISVAKFKRNGKFTNLEWFSIVLSVMRQLDFSYDMLIHSIDGSSELDYNIVFKLYFFNHEVQDIENFGDLKASLIKKMKIYSNNMDVIGINKQLFYDIVGNEHTFLGDKGLSFKTFNTLNKSGIRNDVIQKICRFTKMNLENNKNICYYIYGEQSIGKQYLVNNVCNNFKTTMISIDCNLVCDDFEKFDMIVKKACCHAMVSGGFIYLKNAEYLVYEDKVKYEYINLIFDMICKFSKCVFIGSNVKIKMPTEFYDMCGVELQLPELSNSESVCVWKEVIGSDSMFKDIDVQDLANKFTLTPGQIINAVTQAKNNAILDGKNKVTVKCVTDAIYNQITKKLSDKTTVINAKYSWDDIVLPEKQKSIIMQACNQIKYKHVVYEKWGLKNSFLYGRGLSMLFSGPSGTGKTMAAQVVANELGLEIYRVDLSQVVSKWIGETEKNIGEIFDSAQRSNVVLLFDEMDALFAKRTEVSDSHDKSANLETAYLLQKMEEYSGITIMTTNFINNIDQAFFRRISYVVNFNLPGADARKQMWIKMYPKNAPMDENIDFDFLANNFAISGGNIKNVVITSTFMAASEKTSISMKHILKALEYEITKQGKMISRSEFGKYAYLV